MWTAKTSITLSKLDKMHGTASWIHVLRFYQWKRWSRLLNIISLFQIFSFSFWGVCEPPTSPVPSQRTVSNAIIESKSSVEGHDFTVPSMDHGVHTKQTESATYTKQTKGENFLGYISCEANLQKFLTIVYCPNSFLLIRPLLSRKCEGNLEQLWSVGSSIMIILAMQVNNDNRCYVCLSHLNSEKTWPFTCFSYAGPYFIQLSVIASSMPKHVEDAFMVQSVALCLMMFSYRGNRKMVMFPLWTHDGAKSLAKGWKAD